MEPRTIADLERTEDDATLVAVCYASFIAGHIVVSLVMVVFARRRSEYLRFHAMQSLVAHVLALALLAVLMFAFFATFFGSIFSEAAAVHHPHAAGPPWGFFVLFPLVFVFAIGSAVGSFVTAIVGAIRAMDLRDFTLPLIGRWVFARWFRGRRDLAGTAPVAAPAA